MWVLQIVFLNLSVKDMEQYVLDESCANKIFTFSLRVVTEIFNGCYYNTAISGSALNLKTSGCKRDP